MTTSVSSLALELRLHALESQIFANTSLLEQSPGAGPSRQVPERRPITRRVQDIEETLDRAVQGSEAVKRLIAGYDRYLPLINQHAGLNTDHLPGSQSQADDGQAQGLVETDLLPDSAKVALLLEAAQDIRRTERDLRDIDLLQKREVQGAGRLEEVLPFREVLHKGQTRARSKREELAKARQEVNELLKRYTEFTGTVSDLFVDIHQRLEIVEEAVARAQRRKRKELSERY